MKYQGIYRAKVLGTDVLEEDKLGRLKLEIYPMLVSSDSSGSAAQIRADGTDIEGISLDDLPWAVPATGLFSGAGVGYGSFVIPSVGSYVWVFFEAGDVYQPVYFAEAPTKTVGLPVERLINYPTRRVFKTKNGIIIELDDTTDLQEIKVTHPTGTTIQIDPTGKLNITTVDDTNMNITGNATITASGNLTISGNLVNINP